MSDDKIMVYMKHIRQSGMCSGGAREFFIMHKLDWNRFLNQGLEVEIIEALKDSMATKVAKTARAEHEMLMLRKGS